MVSRKAVVGRRHVTSVFPPPPPYPLPAAGEDAMAVAESECKSAEHRLVLCCAVLQLREVIALSLIGKECEPIVHTCEGAVKEAAVDITQ